MVELSAVETVIRCHLLWHLIWVCTVCQLLLYGPVFNGLKESICFNKEQILSTTGNLQKQGGKYIHFEVYSFSLKTLTRCAEDSLETGLHCSHVAWSIFLTMSTVYIYIYIRETFCQTIDKFQQSVSLKSASKRSPQNITQTSTRLTVSHL